MADLACLPQFGNGGSDHDGKLGRPWSWWLAEHLSPIWMTEALSIWGGIYFNVWVRVEGGRLAKTHNDPWVGEDWWRHMFFLCSCIAGCLMLYSCDVHSKIISLFVCWYWVWCLSSLYVFMPRVVGFASQTAVHAKWVLKWLPSHQNWCLVYLLNVINANLLFACLLTMPVH